MAEDSLIKGQNREIERDISMKHFYETFLHLSQNIYHAIWKKKQLRGDKKNGNSNNSSIVASATPSYNVCYLASQLCVCVCVCVCVSVCLCVSDSKSKWVKKSSAWMCCPNILFCEDFGLWFLSQFNDYTYKMKPRRLNSRNLEQLNLSTSTKSATVNKFTTKHKKKKRRQMLRSLWQNKKD